jgi:uncharacterized protein (TIGR02118 family)
VIHQLIFAAPKPGMTENEFQRYWVDVHAVRYASRIPQIRRYLVDTRVPFGDERDDPKWSGVAEIWLDDEEAQLASLQTPEFLHGARLDEPNWAAFWRTVVLDTDASVLRAGSERAQHPGRVKLIRLVKRTEGLSLREFRETSLSKQADLVLEIPGLRRYLQCHTRDASYGIGEAVLDAAYQLWFDDLAALTEAMASPEFQRAQDHLLSIVQERYVHDMVAAEHWIIGPEPR